MYDPWGLEGATVAIPGARTAEQATANVGAGALGPLSAESHAAIRSVYEARIKAVVEKERW